METKYGIISTIHSRKDFYEKILIEMMHEKVNAVILNGIGETPEATSYALKTAAKTNLPIITIPNEEDYSEYYKAVKHAKEKNRKIIDSVTHPHIEQNGHEILILPGTTKPFESKFVLSTKAETGLYFFDKKEAKKNSDNVLKKLRASQIKNSLKILETSKKVYCVHNIESLAEKIGDPEKTTIISPYSREFTNPMYSIDREIFYETGNSEIYSLEHLANQIIAAYSEPENQMTPGEAIEEIRDLIEEGDIMPVYLNHGDEILRNVTEKYGVTKTISSAPIVSAHIAHTDHNVGLPEHVFSTELHYNTGVAEDGFAGILYLKDDKAAYKNITIKENVPGKEHFFN